MQGRIFGMDYNYIRRKLDIMPGDIIQIDRYSENGRFETKQKTTVLKVYPTYVLLDNGSYLECRQLVDLFINERMTYHIIRVHAN